MASVGRTFKGQSAEERRAARRRRLLDAALDLIGTEGWTAATMTAICSHAGLTERYFYESFRDRDALYVALIDEIADETERAVLAAIVANAEAGEEARMRAVVAALLRVLLDDPRKGRAAMLEGLGSAPLQRRRRAILRSFEALVVERIGQFVGSGERVPADEVGLVAVSVVGAVDELLTRRLEGTLDVGDDRFVDHVVRMSQGIALAARATEADRPGQGI
ncbi:MAG: TetR/AcrR family transcriptional regulator [Solirubrobacteraceae bacterium]